MAHPKLLLLLIATAAFQVSAETAYRSVDEQGNVTFSDRPVGGATQQEQIRIEAPAPSAERQQETRQREAELQKAAGEVATPAEPSRADQKKAAREALRDAEKDLEEARQVREGDRKGTASGGSRLTPQYHERVREAEAEVDRARREQEQIR